MWSLWKTVWSFLKNLNMDRAIPVLGIDSKKMKTLIWIWNPKFKAALSIIAKTWKQPKCPSIYKWIKTWYLYTHTHTPTHTMGYYSIKKTDIMSLAATWMGLEIIKLNEVSKWRKINIIWYHLHMKSKKRLQVNLFTK